MSTCTRPKPTDYDEAGRDIENTLASLLLLAFNGVHLVYNRVPVKGGGDPQQATVNRLAISFFALAELLGATDLAEALL
jgi:hypothetical protein